MKNEEKKILTFIFCFRTKGNQKETTFLHLHEKKTNLNSHGFSFEEATNRGSQQASNLTSSSSNTDAGGTELKMKKRSGSKTSLELGRHHAPNLTRQIRQLPPPLIALPTSATTTNLHSTPNYMKSTTSSDARTEQANVRSSKRVTKTLAGMRTFMRRRTPEETSGVKACPYSRCSLNGHVHALLPPFKSFVSARRRAIKTERSMKQRCQSPKAGPTGGSQNCAKLIGRDEAATSRGKVEVLGSLSDGEMCRDIAPRSSVMDWEKGKHYPTYLVDDYECTSKMEEESGEQGSNKIIASAEFVMKSDDRLGDLFDEISADEVSQEFFDEESLNSDTLFTSDNCGSVGSYNYLENLCSKKTSALVLDPVPPAAPAGENNFLLDTHHQNGETTPSMDGEEHDLKHESLPNEDPTREMRNHAPQLLDGPAEETTTTLVDSATFKVIKLDQVSNQTSLGETNRLSAKYPNNIGMNECNQAENFSEVSTKELSNEPYPEFSRKNSSEAECNTVHEVNPRNMEDQNSIQATVKSNQEGDEATCFNPSEVHFLPLEPDPEAEKVNLRHQELDARKNAEEWMVDYALREAVTKIVPARHRKVASLVEAFERVVPTSKS